MEETQPTFRLYVSLPDSSSCFVVATTDEPDSFTFWDNNIVLCKNMSSKQSILSWVFYKMLEDTVNAFI